MIIIFLIVHLIISVGLWYFLIHKNDLMNEEFSFRFFVYLVVYCPFFTEFSLVVILIMKIVRWIKEIKDRVKNRKEYLRQIADRERKIRLGIIKISKDDPYGEEDWV